MSKLMRKVAPIGLKLMSMAPGPIGMAGKVLSKIPMRKTAAVAAAGGVFGAAETIGSRGVGGYRTRMQVPIDPRTGRPYRKRSRQGLSGRDIKGAQKVARLVQAFGFRPKIKPRKRRGR
jgi:hypothetical protein